MQHFENQVYFKCLDVILISALTTANQFDQQIAGSNRITCDPFSACENIIFNSMQHFENNF